VNSKDAATAEEEQECVMVPAAVAVATIHKLGNPAAEGVTEEGELPKKEAAAGQELLTLTFLTSKGLLVLLLLRQQLGLSRLRARRPPQPLRQRSLLHRTSSTSCSFFLPLFWNEGGLIRDIGPKSNRKSEQFQNLPFNLLRLSKTFFY
jgi:hypothetical protein